LASSDACVHGCIHVLCAADIDADRHIDFHNEGWDKTTKAMDTAIHVRFLMQSDGGCCQ
jgi:hypothetical protein